MRLSSAVSSTHTLPQPFNRLPGDRKIVFSFPLSIKIQCGSGLSKMYKLFRISRKRAWSRKTVGNGFMPSNDIV